MKTGLDLDIQYLHGEKPSYLRPTEEIARGGKSDIKNGSPCQIRTQKMGGKPASLVPAVVPKVPRSDIFGLQFQES